jgi:hypothetical protein
MPRGIRAALILGALTLPGLQAASFTFNAVDSGWYQSSGMNSQDLAIPSMNYFAGEFPIGNGFNYHDFFVFNISGLSGTILSATLTIDNGGEGAVVGGPVTFNVSSVSDSTASIESNVMSNTIYSELASGTSYGSQSGIAGPGNVVINLNADALNALASAGSGFVFGGHITPIGDGANHYLFNNSFIDGDPNPVVQLSIVTSSTATPEPASFALLGCGLAGFGLLARRRARS